MKRVKQMKLKKGLTVGALVSEMNACGVLGAGKVGKAAELAKEMFSDRDYTVFLTLAGPLVPGGLRKIIRDLIEQEFVNVVVTTGANMVHDMVEALGHHHCPTRRPVPSRTSTSRPSTFSWLSPASVARRQTAFCATTASPSSGFTMPSKRSVAGNV